MSLDVAKLERVRELAGGIVQARCPACAEGGHDRTGEHLRIYPDGRFGCCLNPKDGEHRKRIFALAGDKSRRQFTVKVGTVKPNAPEARSVAASLTGLFRTLRTAKTGTDSAGQEPPMDVRTLRTPSSDPRACVSGDTTMYKESETAVLSVLAGERLPFLSAGGDLVIPFNSPERFHWWRSGQSVAATLNEVKVRTATCR